MVITDNQDDVVPTELSHEVKPDVGLVRVWWYGPQKGQVDALQHHREVIAHILRGQKVCWYENPMNSGIPQNVEYYNIISSLVVSCELIV